MKKRTAFMGCVFALLMSMTACGQSAPDEETQSTADSSEAEAVSKQEETSDTDTEESVEMDLPYWKGVTDYFGYDVYTTDRAYLGAVSLNIQYPSLKPTSYGWAYQLDPAYVFVANPGFVIEDGELNLDENLLIESLADTFELTKPNLCRCLKSDRNPRYKNFDFTVETAEPVTINGFSMYKYTGIHTYTYEEEDRQCDFVAYSVDTRQAEHSYFTIIVLDDSLSNPSLDPLPEGTIEAYAKKMAESITLKKD